jgi:hypothetical protein
MLRNLAITVSLVLTTSLALMSSASARFASEPSEPFGPGSPSISATVEVSANVAGFTAQGSPFSYLSTLFAGDPASYRAQPTVFGGGGSYAAPPAPGSNVHVPGLQP